MAGEKEGRSIAMAAKEKRGSGFPLSLLVGAVVGVLIGLLWAPQRGEEARSRIRERGQEWRGRLDEFSLRATEEARAALETGRQVAEEALQQGKQEAARRREELESTLRQARGETDEHHERRE